MDSFLQAAIPFLFCFTKHFLSDIPHCIRLFRHDITGEIYSVRLSRPHFSGSFSYQHLLFHLLDHPEKMANDLYPDTNICSMLDSFFKLLSFPYKNGNITTGQYDKNTFL